MYKKAIIYYHQAAGQGEIFNVLGECTKNLAQIVNELTLHLSKEEGDIYNHIQTLNDDDYNVLFLLGGDGTVHELVNGVLTRGLTIPIGILPAGTFNDFVKTLNLPPDPVVASLAMQGARPKAFDVMKVNNRYVLNFVGLGLIVENSQGVQSDAKSKLGKFSYLFSMLKSVTNPTFFDYSIKIDDVTHKNTSSMILVANGEYVGGSKIPLIELSANDGYMNVFIFKESGLKLFSDLVGEKSVENWNDYSDYIEHHTAQTVHIETKEKMEVDVDGEIELETPVSIELLSRKISILSL